MSRRPGKRKLPRALERLPLLAGVWLTCSQTSLAKDGASGLRVVADFGCMRKDLLRPLEMRNFM